MNRQTKAYRKLGKSVVNTGSHPVNNGPTAQSKDMEIFKGAPCITCFASKSKNQMNKRTSPKNYSKVSKGAGVTE